MPLGSFVFVLELMNVVIFWVELVPVGISELRSPVDFSPLLISYFFGCPSFGFDKSLIEF